MRREKKIDSKDEGFTLVELLVSFAVLSLLAVFFANGITFGARMFERSGIASEAAAEIDAAQSVLRLQIGSIYPRHKSGVTSKGQVDFEGDRDEISYWSKLPRAFGDGGYVRTKLAFVKDRTSSLLEISWCETERETECVSKILVDGISGGAFTFLDPKTHAPLVRWDSRTNLPALISIAVDFQESDPRIWPDFAVAPRTDRRANCRFDPVSKRCRRG